MTLRNGSRERPFNPLINIRNLSFAYPEGQFCLTVPRLDVERGGRLAVVGASGSGKTTLLNLIAGIHKPDAGSVSVSDRAVETLTDAARRRYRIENLGLIFQTFELLEYLTVRDNILLPFRISTALKLTSEVNSRVERLAADTGIGALVASYPQQLSQGERQRAAICRALITAPKLILADEPTGNLDPDNKHKVLDILLRQVERNNATLVMVTHDYDLLDRFDRVVDMRELHGRSVA
jgi:putative ABC transport system ATP-binding protein